MVKKKKKSTLKYPYLKWLLPILFLIFILVLFKNYSKGNPVLPSPEMTPLSTANAPTSVTTVPLNASNFVKEVAVDNMCNNPVGMVTYYEKKDTAAVRMSIRSLDDVKSSSNESGLSQIEAYLRNEMSLQRYQDLHNWDLAFKFNCGGGTYRFMKELPDIQFPNTDSAKAMMISSGQDMWGGVTVVVLAKKGNDVIHMSHFFDEQGNEKVIFKPIWDTCSHIDDDFKNADCFRNELYQNVNFQNEAISRAKALVSKFSIQK